ncbi:TPA: hypothetical protein ACK1ZR_003718 [Klebsiella michiganensis]
MTKSTKGPLFAEVHNVPDDYHFTEEELDRIIAGDMFTPRQGAIMARELRVRRKADSEPVAWRVSFTQIGHESNNFTKTYWNEEEKDRWVKLHKMNGYKVVVEPLYRHAQPAPVVPEGLNPETTDLVLRFASALADKLYKAEQKYGRSTDWMKDDWYDDCLQSLWEHIEKGDPRDVAAYCAFMWYHGWVTTDYDRNVQSTCRAAMLNGGKL